MLLSFSLFITVSRLAQSSVFPIVAESVCDQCSFDALPHTFVRLSVSGWQGELGGRAPFVKHECEWVPALTQVLPWLEMAWQRLANILKCLEAACEGAAVL